jgi:hypothetical protein
MLDLIFCVLKRAAKVQKKLECPAVSAKKGDTFSF